MRRPIKYALWALGALVTAYLFGLVFEIGILSGRLVTYVGEYPEQRLTISLTSTDMIQPLLQQIQTFAQNNHFTLDIVDHDPETVRFLIDLSRPDLLILADNETKVRRFDISFGCPEPRFFFGSAGPIAPKSELDHIAADLRDVANRVPGTSFQTMPLTPDNAATQFRGCPAGPPRT